jgi:hypothetical protein
VEFVGLVGLVGILGILIELRKYKLDNISKSKDIFS